MTVEEAIAAAEPLLPGHAAPDGAIDPRWQAIIAIGDFVESDPDAVWSFVLRWGAWPDEDLRAAIATCLLEHLLEYSFDEFMPRVEEAALSGHLAAETVSMCAKFGEAMRADRAARLDRLIARLSKPGRNSVERRTR